VTRSKDAQAVVDCFRRAEASRRPRKQMMVYEQESDIGPVVTLYAHQSQKVQLGLRRGGDALYLAHIKSILQWL